MDLGVASESGADGEDEVVFGVVFGYFFGEVGAGSDEGHVSCDDVPELWEFVDGGAAEEFAKWGDAGVVFYFEEDSSLTFVFVY